MPLFSFKCTECEFIVEKMIGADGYQDVICEECGAVCKRLFSMCGNRTRLNAKDFYNEKILPGVKKFGDDLNSGNDDAFFDICGEN